MSFYGIASFFLPRPHQHACGNQDGDEQSPARVPLEELHLSPSSELQEGLGAEETDPKSPEGTIQGSLGPAEAEEADEQVVGPPLGVGWVCVSHDYVFCGPCRAGLEKGPTPSPGLCSTPILRG